MRQVFVLAMVGMLVTMAGCAVLDSAFGVDPDNPDAPAAPGGGLVGGLLGLLFPGGVGAAGGAVLAALYKSIRGKKYVKAGYALTPAVEEILKILDEKGKLKAEDAKDILVRWQEKLDAREAVEAVRLENPDDPKSE